jgi:hypothetical protein
MATASMTWIDFCRCLVGAPTNEESSLSGDIEVGLDKGLPVAKLRLSLRSARDDLSLADRLANTWTEHDVARRLVELDAVLLIDDFERARDDLVLRIADLCKLLTQAYVSVNSRVVLVGSGDIYQRLLKQNPALDERVSQVSLGAFKYRNDARAFMILGFNRLNLWHPWNSRFPREFEQRSKCADAIWEAADGLPKSLNRLGYDIALRAEGRKAVSAHDIIDQSQKMTEEHWIQYAQEYPEVIAYLEATPAAVSIVRCLYEHGIARIHKLPHVIDRVATQGTATLTEAALEEAINDLASVGFLVRTGKSGELLFVRDPTAAHTLGVVMRDPSRFPGLPGVPSKPALQLAFPLPLPDSDEPNSDAPSHDA